MYQDNESNFVFAFCINKDGVCKYRSIFSREEKSLSEMEEADWFPPINRRHGEFLSRENRSFPQAGASALRVRQSIDLPAICVYETQKNRIPSDEALPLVGHETEDGWSCGILDTHDYE